MNKGLLKFAIVLFLQIVVATANAEPLRIAITEFTTVGVEQPQELKKTLKSLLSSRLAAKGSHVIDEGGQSANATVSGEYFAIGKTFSIDATVKGAAGEMLGQKYVQGSTQDDLIPAISKLAEQIHEILPQPQQNKMISTVSVTGGSPAVNEMVASLPKPSVKVASEDVVRTNPDSKKVIQQTRIEGALLGIAPGRRLPGNEREFLVADERHVYLYRQTESLKKIAEFPLKTAGKILSIDSADVDGDGELEIYVTVIDREELVSLVLAIANDGLVVVADKLPQFFRAIELNGQKKQVLAQQSGRGADDFYGDVRIVVKKGAAFTLGEPVKLVGKADVFTFNKFTDGSGKNHIVVIDSSGRLHIHDETGKELWKSMDRFGGSETYYLRDEQQMQNVALDRYRWHFIEKRMVVTSNGEIIIPQNSGSFVVGNSRSYDKNALFAYVWNGASLEEVWHTKESAGYLADYFYDAEHGELVTLEQVQKEGLFSKGASVVLIKKISK